jgi:hypothetical protein
MNYKNKEPSRIVAVRPNHRIICKSIKATYALVENKEILKWREQVHSNDIYMNIYIYIPPDHLLLDSAPNIGPLISRWELDKFKSC